MVGVLERGKGEKEKTSRCVRGRQDGLNTGHNRMRTETGERLTGWECDEDSEKVC